MGSTTTCYKCDERFVGCHSVCEKYIAFTKENEKNLEEKRIRNEKRARERDFIYGAVNRMKNVKSTNGVFK